MELNKVYYVEINKKQKWFIKTDKGYLADGHSQSGEVKTVIFSEEHFEEYLIKKGFNLEDFD